MVVSVKQSEKGKYERNKSAHPRSDKLKSGVQSGLNASASCKTLASGSERKNIRPFSSLDRRQKLLPIRPQLAPETFKSQS